MSGATGIARTASSRSAHPTGFVMRIRRAVRRPCATSAAVFGWRSPLVGAKRRRDVRAVAQTRAERHRIHHRLRGALPGMRQQRMRRVAEQRHHAAAPDRDRIAIGQLVEPQVFGGRGDGAKRGVEPRRQVRHDRVRVAHAGRHQLARERQEPVDAGVAGADQRRLDAGTEVVDGRQIAKMIAGRHAPRRARPRCRTGAVAARRVQSPADDGADAVGADQQIAFDDVPLGEAQVTRGHRR